jgi:flavin reductase (DIM6/NTAB) family NADH-FMN oxidoreductase RutF
VIQPPAEAFRTVMSRLPTGVTVVTTLIEGEPHGMTASAVSSLSLDPLLVLVCIERDTPMCQLTVDAGYFGISILAADQAAVSDRFADPDRPSGAAQFDGIPFRPAVTGAPILDDVLAWVDCRLWATYDGGDHVIVVGEVVDQGLGEPDDALVYYRSAYTWAPQPADPRR